MFALAAAFVGLLYYIKNFENGPTRMQRLEDAKKPVVLEARADRIERVKIEGGNGAIIMAKAPDGLWRMKSPVAARGDMIAMESITNTLADFRAESRVAGSGLKPGDFGLDRPSLKIEATLKGGKKVSLSVGGKTPMSENYYLMRAGGPAVYIVSGISLSAFGKSVLELRDRSILENYIRSDVEAVSVAGGGRETVCSRTQSKKNEKGKRLPEWRFENRATADCEMSADALLSGAAFTEAKEIVDNPAANLADYGLDNPKYKIEVKMNKGAPMKLEIGSESGGLLFVRNAGRNEIYRVEPALIEKIDEFRKAASMI